MSAITSRAGLCGTCARARRIVSARGSTFIRCEGHDRDPTLPKYPSLPRLACHGYEQRTDTNATETSEAPGE